MINNQYTRLTNNKYGLFDINIQNITLIGDFIQEYLYNFGSRVPKTQLQQYLYKISNNDTENILNYNLFSLLQDITYKLPTCKPSTNHKLIKIIEEIENQGKTEPKLQIAIQYWLNGGAKQYYLDI